MRTRLDEIVCRVMKWDLSYRYRESEGNSVYPITGQQIDEMAQAIFRHGVEQALIERFAPSVFSPPDIQPAPGVERAEEHDAKFCTPSDNAATCACKCHRKDRRKGERRKILIQKQSFIWQRPEDSKAYGSIFYDEDSECWKWNRRFGKDRRK